MFPSLLKTNQFLLKDLFTRQIKCYYRKLKLDFVTDKPNQKPIEIGFFVIGIKKVFYT